jgi:hypothetical protein
VSSPFHHSVTATELNMFAFGAFSTLYSKNIPLQSANLLPSHATIFRLVVCTILFPLCGAISFVTGAQLYYFVSLLWAGFGAQ